MNRINFIRAAGVSLASLFMRDVLFANRFKGPTMNLPDEVTAILDDQLVSLTGKDESWKYKDLIVELLTQGESIAVAIESPRSSLTAVTLRWKQKGRDNSRILNDHWERTYGDVSWHAPSGSELLPWYFMEHDGRETIGVGVKTGTGSFCFWQIGKEQVNLTMDTRFGGGAVRLGGRRLAATCMRAALSEFLACCRMWPRLRVCCCWAIGCAKTG